MNGIKIIPPQIAPTFPTKTSPTETTDGNDSFGDFLKKAIDGVQDLQSDADTAQDKLVRGEAAELHQVMIAAEKAGISFDLLLEIRKRLIDAYQELIRMPV